MRTVQKILFPVDFSRSCVAMAAFVKRAAELFGASITLLHAIDPSSLGALETFELLARPPSEVAEEHRTIRTEKLNSFLTDDFPRSSQSRVALPGDPAETIVGVALRDNFDLIVMPTHAGHRFRRMLLGSTTAKVLNQAHCPVLTSTHSEVIAPKPLAHKRWLCALDLTPYSQNVLSVGRAIRRKAGGELALIHVVPSLDREPSADFQDRDSTRILRANEQLQQLAKNLEVAASIRVLAGPVKETLVRHAETEDADVLIVGRSCSETPLERLRDLTYTLVRDSPVPVLSV